MMFFLGRGYRVIAHDRRGHGRSERFLSCRCQVCLVEGGSRGRGSQLMECSLHRALQGTLAVLTRVRPKDLDGPTPCASWDVRALVNHFVGTARWWAATIAGDGGVADADYAARDFVAAYEESIRIAVAAFGADGSLDRTIRLPFGELPWHCLAEPGHD
jgi:pimeloyl-ACP methyl ester carboxylesterase